MTTPTPSELQALQLSSYAALPRGDRIAPPTAFLSLAPTTSASYPSQPTLSPRAESVGSSISSSAAAIDSAVIPKPDTDAAAVLLATEADITPAGVIVESIKNRRSSSTISSESAGSVKQRFLKLGPVHWGEDKDGKGDWVDVE